MTNEATAKLIVCERSGRWASAVRRERGDRRPRLRETRDLDDAWRELAEAPASCVILEATPANVERIVAWLERLAAEAPAARALVVGDADLTAAERLLLVEAGAAWFHGDRATAHVVAGVADRHLAPFRPADRTWREELLARLPLAAGAEFDPPGAGAESEMSTGPDEDAGDA